MKATSVYPILQVENLTRAIAFYCDRLGFSEEFIYGDPPFYAGVKMGDVIIHLNTSSENAPKRGLGSVYVLCDEVDAYYQDVRDNGVEITSPLDSYPYGMRDFQVKDLDGNVIGFGCSLEDDTD